MAKKKKSNKSLSLNEAIGAEAFINNEKIEFVLGLCTFLISILIFISFFSFFSTGKADQSLLEDLRPQEWLNHNKLFQNSCGSIGAITSHFFITKGFGLSSLLIPTFLILVGLKLIKVYSINLWKWFLSLSIIMFWSSIAFTKFLSPLMGEEIFNPGGYHGLFCVQFLEQVVGTPGLIVFLLLTALTFFTYITSETITLIRRILNPIDYIGNKIRKQDVTTEPMGLNNVEEKEQTVVGEPTIEEKTNEEVAIEEYLKEEQPIIKIEDEDLDTDESQAQEIILPTIAPIEEKKEIKDLLTVEVAAKTEEASSKALNVEEVMKTPINPKEPFTKYKYPTLELLKKYDNSQQPQVDMEEIKANNARIVEVLNSFKVAIQEIKATVGPTITLYEITPAEGVRISKIRNLEDDIALNLSALGIRIIAPIPGKGTIGIEVPNRKANIVSMESILNTKKFQETTMELPLALGKTITNEVYMVDLAKIPHLLVAGATGQGKSVGLNTIITSLLYKKHPNELKIVLIDPKKVEFSVYSPIVDHFMATVESNEDEPIITDVKKVVHTLNSLCTLMDHRYDLLKEAGARNIKEYNHKFLNHKLDLTKGHEFMPYIVVIVDEYGDLIMTAGKEVELPITRIAQLARAVGIHMIIATQRPTANIITGTIKANFPGRMAFKVSSMTDSRTIIDRSGANQLIGRGDMLILNGNEPVRVQCAFVDTPEIEKVNEYISKQPGPVCPLTLPEPATDSNGNSSGGASDEDMRSLDSFFEEAAQAIVSSQQGSTSMIQRRFAIGYNRAGRLMDQLERVGIVGPAQGSKPRDVLVTDMNTLNDLLANLRS